MYPLYLFQEHYKEVVNHHFPDEQNEPEIGKNLRGLVSCLWLHSRFRWAQYLKLCLFVL